MLRLTQRQNTIRQFISKEVEVGISDIMIFLKKENIETSRFSVVRDLNTLLKGGFIEKGGGGRSTKYKEVSSNVLHTYVDMDTYFKVKQEERLLASESFVFDVFEKVNDIFSKKEVDEIQKINDTFRKNIKTISKTIKKIETERFTIELSWKSSQIEGNTYTLLDTEDLIKNKVQAFGHKKEEAVMILNHKKAIDFILSNSEYFKTISLKKIEELHRLLTDELDITQSIRKFPVGITGTNYRPLDNEFQIKEAVEKMIHTINSNNLPIEKALLALALLSYIQPFEDGNKRTARILANALLLANNYCPLSYRNVKESDYKKAILIFYESHNIDPLKRIFVEQFKFAVQNYFQS